MHSGKISALFIIFILFEVVHVSAKKGVLFRRVSLKPPMLLDAAGYRTTYACEGKTLNIICDEGIIHLIRANYGRFSISICNDHGNLDWRVNCMSHHSFLIMQDRCSLKSNCSVNVSSTTFHDPCPGTLKYLEVQYHCGTDAPVLTTPSTSTSPPAKATYTSNVTAVPIGKIQTVTHRLIVTTAAPTLPTIISLLKTSTVSPRYKLPTTAVSFNKSETFYEYSTVGKAIDIAPTMGTVPSSAATSTVISTTVFFSEDYCQPILARGIKWTWTKAGQTAFSKCPDGATGTAKWYCKEDPAHWSPGSPNLLQCHSLWLENLKERLQAGDSISSITSELAVMSSAKPLYSEDLKIISELIQQALYKSVNSMENFLDTWHRYHVLRELLQSSVQTLNNLLDKKQDVAWKDLQVFEKKLVISTFLERLDESALLLAETSSDDSSFSVIKSKVWLSLQVLKTKNTKSLYFPTFSEISSEAESSYWGDLPDRLVLPQEAIEEFAKNGFYKVVFSVFKKLNEYLIPGSIISHHPDPSPGNITRIINSRIIGASLDKSGSIKLRRPAIITFKHLIEENVTNPVCVFWDFHLRDWSAKGCLVESTNKTHTVCLCGHLTNFALIMERRPDSAPAANSDFLYMIVTTGCIIAIIALVLTLIVLFMLSLDLSEDSTFIHRNMFLVLLLSELVFLGGIKQTSHRLACSLIAGLLQYLFLVTFSWMFFECYHQYITLIRSCDGKKSKSWWYYATAYVVPGIITGISAIIDPSSYGTSRSCWLQADNYFVFSFVGPAVSIIFGGLVFLFIALCMFYHNMSSVTAIKGNDNVNLTKYKIWNFRSFFLVVLLSLTWTSALIFINDESTVLAYIFSVLNSVQGVAIIWLYCFLNEKVKEDIRKLLNHDLCFKQRKQEPQITPEIVNHGSTSRECDSQEFWTLPKEKMSASTSNIASDPSATLPARSSMNETEVGVRSQSAFWMPRASSTWKPAYHAEKTGIEEQDTVVVNIRKYQAAVRKEKKVHQFFIAPDSNGQFLDHIYETIDDDTLPDEDDGTMSFQASQRYPPPENYYGDHSDLSQHSSSSYGYDQQPLILGLQNGQNVAQVPYPVLTDSHVNEHPENSQHMWEQNQNQSFRKQRSPSEKPVTLRTSYDGNHQSFSTERQAHAQKGSSELWETPLPDLLRSPPDSSVVLAVLDGDKVVNRIQQDDVLIKPQYKLSTYC
ncbi:latrophilin Cirl [Nephila pilipes]|uniref:Latrophilin Cirl n=1 Tax=Nephila pilipes TaxID=299642 RepID=A0A8X6Q869_NEPPI|nr:latrophilin Cirl [Nephila pilipes]